MEWGKSAKKNSSDGSRRLEMVRGKIGRAVKKKLMKTLLTESLRAIAGRGTSPSVKKFYEQYLQCINWYPHDFTAADLPTVRGRHNGPRSNQCSVHTVLGAELELILFKWWLWCSGNLTDGEMEQYIKRAKWLADNMTKLPDYLTGNLKEGYYFEA